MIAKDKREKLMKHIPDNALIILVGNTEMVRNGDVMYPFRQNSDVLLLTGINTPDIALIGYKSSSETSWILYSDEITEKEKIWGTSRLSHREIMERSGITEIRPSRFLTKDIRAYTSNGEHIYVRNVGVREKSLLSRLHITYRNDRVRIIDSFLQNLRIIKSREEVEKIRKAIDITQQAYHIIRANIKPQMYEYEIEAYIAGIYRAHHTIEAYPTIVASGMNSCTLHYTQHDKKIEENEHILIDFGAEYEGYAADITRVFFTREPTIRQKAVYDAVLDVKNYAQTLLMPGQKKSEYEVQVRAYMNEKLFGLGLIPPECNNAQEREILSRKYYPHSTSHFLGLDVHDVGSREEEFQPGMVITCEPGIYIREEGIGMRLEDDLLITEDGFENLSKDIPFL